MKRKISIYLVCFFSISNFSFSQNILERALQLDYYTEVNAFIYDSTIGQYLSGGNYWDVNTGFFSPAWLSAADTTGNLNWINNVTVFGEGCNVYNLVSSNDGNFIFSGFDMPVCDVYGDFGYVQKVSPQGSIIWIKTFYPPAMTSFYKFGRSLAYLSNQTIRVSVDSNVYVLDNIGDSVTYSAYNYRSINQIVETPDHFLLLACDSGMIRTDTSGNIISSSSFFKKNRNIVIKNSNEYIFNSDKIIYKTDSLFNIVNQVNLQASVSEIRKIKSDSSLFWVLCKSASGLSEMIKLDDTLAISSTYVYNSFNGSDFEAKNFIVHQNNYVLTGHEHTQDNSHVFIKSFDKTSNAGFNYQKDVGLISLRADTSYANPSGPACTVNLDIYATVKNFGNDTITNVHLNALINNFLGICLPFAYSENFNNLLIFPGDTVELHVGWIYDYVWGFNPQNNDYTLCMWTSSPDEKMDVYHSNDNLCHTFTITNFTWMEELKSDSQISIFPNPCTNYLETDLKEYLNKFELSIWNAVGQKIETYSLTSQKEKIDVSEFPKGIYFFQFISEDKIINKKIIKQ